MIRNTAGQIWEVEAQWTTGAPYLGGAATLTAKLSKDGGAYGATSDTSPTELESGRYAFSLSQAETDALALTLLPVCSVAGVIVRAVPQSQITTPAAWDWTVVGDLSGLAQTGEAATAAASVTLAANGLDAITVTAPTGVATTFPQMVVQLWRRFFKKATKTATEIKTYGDNGTTVVTTQAIAVSGDDETQGAAT